MPNPSQDPPASSKAQNWDSKGKAVLCSFKIQIEKQNSGHGYSKDQCQYPNQDQDSKPQSGSSKLKLKLIYSLVQIWAAQMA